MMGDKSSNKVPKIVKVLNYIRNKINFLIFFAPFGRPQASLALPSLIAKINP